MAAKIELKLSQKKTASGKRRYSNVKDDDETKQETFDIKDGS